MKTMKKLLVSLLIVAMLASLFSVGVLADQTITISSAQTGATYNFYKVFDVEEVGSNMYRYKIDSSSVYYSTVQAYFDLTQIGSTSEYYATAKSTFDAGVFALAISQLTGKTVSYTADAASSTHTQNVANGYYVVTSDGGSIPFAISVPNAAGDYEISEKNGLPLINKYVDETESVGETLTATVSIGDTVYYKIVIAAEAGAMNYKVVDTLPAGLTAPEASKIKVEYDGNDVTASAAISVNGQEVTVDLSDYCEANTIAATKKFVITYPAVLDTDATIGNAGNKNGAVLSYGSGLSKDAVITTVFVGGLSFDKVDGSGAALAGATFKLTREVAGTTEYAKLSGSDPTYTVTGWTTTEADAGVITTETRKIIVNGLGAGDYTLIETAAPANYIKAGDTVVSVTATTSGAEITNIVAGYAKITNLSGSVLPETGGMGTTMFYVLGGILAVSAAAVLFARKRREEV